MTLTVPSAIFAEAFLSFIGLGIQAPFASWGVMANDSLGAILSGHWWTLFFPAFFISFTIFAFNVLGDENRKSTRLNSIHVATSYAVFCLKTKQILTSY